MSDGVATTPKPLRTAAELAELAFERIRIEPVAAEVLVRDGDRVLARSRSALALHETDHEVRYYLPRTDVDFSGLSTIEQSSHCPFKGDASEYWALTRDDEAAPVAWSYPDPIPASRPIAGHLAFYDTVAVELRP